jgi:DNA recombination protein RmuC
MWALWAVAGLAVGGLVGFVVGWAAAGRRAPGAGNAALEAELRARLEAAETGLGQAREQATQRERDLARAEAERQAQAALLAQERGLHERQLTEAREARDKALADMREAFKALSAEALSRNIPEFIRQAGEAFARFQETAKGDLSQRQEAIAGLLKPLESQLKTYQDRLQQAGTAQAETLGAVRKQLETLTAQSQTLASETERFRMVLRSNQARGRWGEETLRRVVEAAGMSAHCDFIEQVAEEDRKPDMIVRLPGDRLIVVDAKVPDLDFLGALDTADAAKRGTLLEQHARKLKDTIRDLARRDYPAQFPQALDHVVLFLPAESLFSAALEGDRDLIVWAADQRILLATPASLIALLRAVAVSWQQDAQRQNAEQIVEAATELYDRVAVLVSHFGGIGQHLRRAGEAFNRAVGSYDTRVRPSGERLRAMGVRSAEEKRLDTVETVDATLRLPAPGSGGEPDAS